MIKFNGAKKSIGERASTLKNVIKSIAKDHNYKIGQIDYILVNDEKILEINRQSLQHDYYTDIITFDYSSGNVLEGEIYISIERVEENAKLYKELFHVELSRVVFHGILHMVGYKDKSKTESNKMRELEMIYINQYLKTFHVEQ
jgi:probable rRNA maturation factor